MAWSEVMAMGFTVFTLLILVIAVMDHHWILVKSDRHTYYSGIWKVCIKLVCANIIAMSPNVQGAKTLLVLALFCGFVGASFMTFTYRYSESFEMYRFQVAAMGSFITAALVFLALSIYTIRISTHGMSRKGTVTYQWSFYLAWTTCPCFILSGLFGLIAHQRLMIHGSSFKDRESTASIATMSSSMTSSDWSRTSTSSDTTEEEGEKDAESQSQDLEEQEGKEGKEGEEEAEEKIKWLDQVVMAKEAVLV